MTDLATDGAVAAEFARRPLGRGLAHVAEAAAFVPFPITRPLLVVSDAAAAIMLAVDLLVVSGCVIARVLFNAPVEWADDVARGLMVGSSFFGAASAMARHESLGIAYFVAPPAPGVARGGRRRRRAADPGDVGLRRLLHARPGLEDDGPDHRVRPAAGMDVLSDGRRHGRA